MTVLAWHYHDDLAPGPEANVTVALSNLPPDAQRLSVEEYRIDDDHANAFVLWQRMGSPPSPTADQKAALERAGHLAAPERSTLTSTNGSAELRVRLPRQAISLLVMGW